MAEPTSNKRAKKTRKADVVGETPLCIRFRPGDLERVAECAARDSALRSVWIRETALLRASQIIENISVAPLTYKTAGGVGDQVCIRFKPQDFERVVRAATRERAAPSTWIRAVVMHKVDAMMPTKRGNGQSRRAS